MINKIKKALDEGGLSTLIQRTYNFILLELLPEPIYKIYCKILSHILPDRKLNYNRVEATGGKKLSFLLPQAEEDDPQYEMGLISALREEVKNGDKVVVIGGGRGITSIVAKKKAGSNGEVLAFEPVEELCKTIRKNAKINDVDIDVRNRYVGIVKEPDKSFAEDKKISPSNLPRCDVLEIDCEGAEIEIIDNLDIRPEKIIVETHGLLGAPTDEVRKSLEQKNYNIKNIEIAEPVDKIPEEDDLKVITAEKSDV